MADHPDAAYALRSAVADKANAMEILQSVNHATLAQEMPARTTAHKVTVEPCEIMGVRKSPRAAQTTGGTTQEVEAPMPDKRNAAREALAAHDALRATDLTEPPLDSEGMPFDGAAWKVWYEGESKPAYARWDKAMDALDNALMGRVGRHPFTFRPICEEILREAD